jgi:pyruvate ferredoxin oxidoreductase gamma subunit
MFTIRFHGRGGQGMKTASRLLGSAFFLENFEVQDAPRYGAERRGAPMSAYVRADRQPINARGIILQPGLVIVADDSLVPIPAAGVLAGITERTVLLIASHEPEPVWRNHLNLKGPILIIP